MATNNLTPELLARITAYYAQPASSGWSPNMATPYSEDGMVYQSGAQQGWGQDGVGQTGPMTSIYNYDPNKQEAGKDRFNVYNPDGTFSNQGTFKTDDAMQTFLMALAAAGGMQFLPGGAFGGGAGGAGAVAGDAYLPGQLGVDGANLSASIPGTSFMNSSGLNTMLEGAGLTGSAPGGTVAGDAYLPGQLGVDGVNMSKAALPGTSFLNSSGINTMLDKAGLSGATKAGGGSGLLGLGATVLGALAGAQGQDTSQTSVKSMDPRMDKLFYEDLAPRVQGLLAKQMAPGYLQGYDDMRSVGQSLLNAPIAGNGFNRFFGGR